MQDKNLIWYPIITQNGNHWYTPSITPEALHKVSPKLVYLYTVFKVLVFILKPIPLLWINYYQIDSIARTRGPRLIVILKSYVLMIQLSIQDYCSIAIMDIWVFLTWACIYLHDDIFITVCAIFDAI